MKRPLAVSTGDPGGVGPFISVSACLQQTRSRPVALFGDAEALTTLAEAAGCERQRLVRVRPDRLGGLQVGQLGLVDTGLTWDAEARSHQPTAAGGRAQLAALDAALSAIMSGSAAGLVTAPVSKEAVSSSGAPFIGHTEHLARAAGLPDDQVTMMFLGPRLRTALVTTHESIARLPSCISSARVKRATLHLAQALLRLHDEDTKAGSPRLAVAGLNPHAGEHGLFGDEEQRLIQPALEQARQQQPLCDGSVVLVGLLPAETAFRQAAAGVIDGVVAMFHDQATIASKLLDWGEAVNVTWGLPFVRTSVDHGVAYDAAAQGCASADGMSAALRMAERLCTHRS